MRLRVIALDYDGTIATDGGLDPGVRAAIGEAQAQGIRVVLVTGRILEDLRKVAGDLSFLDAVVAENGAVLAVPGGGRATMLALPPPPSLLGELARRGIPIRTGASVVEADASHAQAILRVVRDLELPLVLVFNRGSLMLLRQSVSKASGLRSAVTALRLSTHNTLAIGDAENDHELLAEAEIGAAVAWGSRALMDAADQVVPGSGPASVAPFLRRVIANAAIVPRGHRRQLLLGYRDNGDPISLAVRDRNVLVVGEPRSGKSWIAGLLCEQLILQGYCVCVIDPEGDYASLEPLPGVVVLGGDTAVPQPREVIRLLRHPDMSLVLDLSHLTHGERHAYVQALLPLLAALRRRTGLPHRIVLDEAHYFLRAADVGRLLDLELHGYTFVTFRTGTIPQPVLQASEAVIAARERDPDEVRGLAACQPAAAVCPGTWSVVLGALAIGEAAVLPCTDEARGELVRIRLATRQTPHVRHRTKYTDVPVSREYAFVFTRHGRAVGPPARTLEEFVRALREVPADVVAAHMARGDLSRWVADIYADEALSARIRDCETAAPESGIAHALRDVIELIGSRYEIAERR